MRSFIGSFAFLASAALLFVSVEKAAAEDFQISAYGGIQSAPHSDIDVSDGTSFTAGWEGKSFQAPQYWGVRGIWWLEDYGRPNWGVSLDYTHTKVYADDDTLAKSPGWTHFEFTDGLNILTLNALYRMPIANTGFTPYVGLGAGINVPHVEVTRPQGKTFDYEFGGATLQAQAGVDYKITDRWSVFAEYKGNYSFVDVPIDSGDRLKTNVFTNAVNLGVSFHF